MVQVPRTFAVTLVLVLTATVLSASPASEEEPAAAMEKEMVTAYGGTLTFAKTGTSTSADIVVPGGWAEALIDPVFEKLGAGLDHDRTGDPYGGTAHGSRRL